MDRVIRPEDLEKAVMKALGEYGDKASEKIEEMCKGAARATRKDLKGSAPTGGEYAKGWSQRMVGSGAYKTTSVVYNRKYQLVHLLENPHATGRYKGGKYPSGDGPDYTGTVERIEQKNVNEFYQEVLNKL